MAVAKKCTSLCMIVRDEQHNLEACLAPVAGLFDEIIITDTGSRDATIDIARRFTPHVYHFPWCDDFSAARNESLRHATGDWIFWLDADDRIRPSQVGPLRELLQQLDDQRRVYMLNTVVLSSRPEDEPRFVSHPRLFRRYPEVQWRGRVHEQLESDVAEPPYQRLFSNIVIEHVGYLDQALAHRKSRRKLRLLQMDYAVDPNNPNTLFHLGMALAQIGNYPEAKRHFLRLINLNLVPTDPMRWIYNALIDLSHLTGNLAEATRYAERGLALFPDDEYLLYAQAKTLYICKNFQAAIDMLSRALRAPRRELLFQATGNIKTKLVPLMLGAAYRLLREYDPAERAFHAVLSADSEDQEALFNLGLVYLDQGRRTDLIMLMQKMFTTSRGASNAKLLAALCYLRHGNLDIARQLIDDAIANDPTLIRARMLRVEWLSRSHAPLEHLSRALNDVLRIDSGLYEARSWLHKIRQRQAAAIPPAVSDWSSSSSMLAGAPAYS